MICQKCQQRPATVFFSQTVGNETTQAHLCEVCAQEQSQAYGGMMPMNFNPFAAFSEFFSNFMPWGEANMAEAAREGCPHRPNPSFNAPIAVTSFPHSARTAAWDAPSATSRSTRFWTP